MLELGLFSNRMNLWGGLVPDNCWVIYRGRCTGKMRFMQKKNRCEKQQQQQNETIKTKNFPGCKGCSIQLRTLSNWIEEPFQAKYFLKEMNFICT